MSQSDSPWTPGNVQLLRTWWCVSGMSATQIAREFRNPPLCVKVSRCAVIGKLQRLGLTRFEQGKNCFQPPKPRAHHTAPTKKAPRTWIASPHRVHGAERGDHNTRFIDIRSDQCQMFVGSESGALGLVCGLKATHGKWCEACAGLVYVPTSEAA